MPRIINKACVIAVFVASVSCKKTETKIQQKPTESVSLTDEKPVNKQQQLVYKKFSGAWFDIEYPANFKAENSLKSSTSEDGFDSALFTSPDGKVQFYVFSPQWSGNPADIKVTPGEKIIEASQEKNNGVYVKRWTVAANDGSYSRSYEETSETLGSINKIFGIKYASKSDLESYRDEYLHFKNSLEQYAD